jgi:serine protease AprX
MTETVLIYATRRQRKQLTRQGIEILTEYEDYVLAQATQAEVAALQASGYEVEIYEAAPATPGVREVGLAARAQPPQGPPPAEFGPGPHHYVVEFGGPIKPEWLAAIEAHGGRALEPMPPASYVIALDGPAYDWITKGPDYVHSVVHYGTEMRVDAGLTESLSSDPLLARGLIRGEPEAAAAPPGVERVSTIFSVRFFEADDLVAALPAIRDLGGTPGEVAAGSTVTTVSFDPADPAIGAKVAKLVGLHGVRVVEPYALRQLRNDVAAGLMGAREVSNPAGLGLSGRGEVVGVADSGLDTGNATTIHPDFAGRVAAIHSWPVTADWSTVVTNVGGDDGAADTRSGHGTHVTGSVCGNGSASLAVQPVPVRGLAFEGNLVFQAVEQRLQWTDAYRKAYYQQYHRYPPDSGLAGLPVDLNLLFQQAYDAGVRVHNNSWGGGDFGAYDDYATAVDRFMWEHKDFLILFAAGNDGADGNRDGVVDEGSLTPPGTAKNCLTVGAAETTGMTSPPSAAAARRATGGSSPTWSRPAPTSCRCVRRRCLPGPIRVGGPGRLLRASTCSTAAPAWPRLSPRARLRSCASTCAP